MGVIGDPILADPAARQRHRRAAGSLIGRAVLVVAGRIEDAHADRGEAVWRDDRADVVHAVAEAGGDRPDVAPLRALDGDAAGNEILKGAEGDHVLGEERVRTGEIDRLHVLRETPKPGLNVLEIIRIDWRDHSITSNLLGFCRDVSTEPSSRRRPGPTCPRPRQLKGGSRLSPGRRLRAKKRRIRRWTCRDRWRG